MDAHTTTHATGTFLLFPLVLVLWRIIHIILERLMCHGVSSDVSIWRILPKIGH